MVVTRIARFRDLLRAYPRQFWVLIVALFIDRLGGALMFPYLTLYITRKFGVGMTEVGVVFALFSMASVVGGTLGGALTDRLGRKSMLIVGLLFSGFTSLMLGLAEEIQLVYTGAVIVGLFANIGGPAQQAMVADLLPEAQRAQGFGILRVVANLAVTVGPALGGLLAARSYLLIFVGDALFSTITALIVLWAIQETKPESSGEQVAESWLQTFRGYGVPLRNTAFVAFIATSFLLVLVAMQMGVTLPVYLRDVHGVPERGYGYILSLNALLVVLFQFPVSRWSSRQRPLLIMALGAFLYGLGSALYGFVSLYTLFLVAIIIVSLGEMLTAPTGQALVARYAPADMRGRYMALYGFSWMVPQVAGPLLTGRVMDTLDPRWVWYGAGIVGSVTTLAFLGLYAWERLREKRVRNKRKEVAHV